MKAITELKQGLSEGWKSVADGWGHIRHRAATAITRFKPTAAGGRSSASGDAGLSPRGPGCARLAGEVFEDKRNVVVRLEVPGMGARDFDLQVRGDLLTIHGEKRSSRESTDGRYRLLECAYGSFERIIALPAPVRADKAQATYRQGVLRIELPKVEVAEPRAHRVTVH